MRSVFTFLQKFLHCCSIFYSNCIKSYSVRSSSYNKITASSLFFAFCVVMAEGGKNSDLKDLDDMVKEAIEKEGGVTGEDMKKVMDKYGHYLRGQCLSKDEQEDLIDPIVDEVNEAFKSLVTHHSDFKFFIVKNDLEPQMHLSAFSLGLIAIFPKLKKTISLSKTILQEKDSTRMHLLMMDLYAVLKDHIELNGDFDAFDGCGHRFDDPDDVQRIEVDRTKIYDHCKVVNDLQYAEVGGRSRIRSTGYVGECLFFIELKTLCG